MNPASHRPCPGTRSASDASDRDALVAKVRAVMGLGVRHIGLFYDDIPMELQYSEDRAAYDDLAAAHVALAQHLFAALPADARLFVCPYSGCPSTLTVPPVRVR